MKRFEFYIGMLLALISFTLYMALDKTQTVFDPEHLQILVGVELIVILLVGFQYHRLLNLSVKSEPPITNKPTVQNQPKYIPRQKPQKQRQPKRKPRQSRRKA